MEIKTDRSVIPGMISDSRKFQNAKGCISLLTPSFGTANTFEIYCISGSLFDDIERFDTEADALAAISKYLGEPAQ